MFSGIVEEVGAIESLDRHSVQIRAEMFGAGDGCPDIGDSIAVSGVCLSVVELADKRAKFDLATETLRRTNLRKLELGSSVNLERALRMGTRLDGHIVQGHVDDTVEVLSLKREENTTRLCCALPDSVSDLLVPKGSVCLDGVSLTIGELENDRFSVYLIPHTISHTGLGKLRVGSLLNLEADCIARYVKGIIEPYAGKN